FCAQLPAHLGDIFTAENAKLAEKELKRHGYLWHKLTQINTVRATQ
ncbi:unnamed protein product, partial [marine sediment metagenome]